MGLFFSCHLNCKEHQSEVSTCLSANLRLIYCHVDTHRQSWKRGLKCGVVYLLAGDPVENLQWRQLWVGKVLCHCCYRFYAWWEPSEPGGSFVWTWGTTTVEELCPDIPQSELLFIQSDRSVRIKEDIKRAVKVSEKFLFPGPLWWQRWDPLLLMSFWCPKRSFE